MRDAWLDLLLGSGCVVCGRAGRLLCGPCAAALPSTGREARPTPCPAGLAPSAAAGEYDGAVKLLVNAHKERQHFALAAPLGALLAGAATVLLGNAPFGPVVLVPVPSRPAVVRARGHDPVLRMTRVAAARLRGRGHDVGVARLLRGAVAVRDQAGLDAAARAANLAGAMAVRRGPARQLLRHGPARVLVTDDVITTGATAREAQRVLEDAGLPVVGIATVAATRRRTPPAGGPGPGGSLPLSGPGD